MREGRAGEKITKVRRPAAVRDALVTAANGGGGGGGGGDTVVPLPSSAAIVVMVPCNKRTNLGLSCQSENKNLCCRKEEGRDSPQVDRQKKTPHSLLLLSTLCRSADLGIK